MVYAVCMKVLKSILKWLIDYGNNKKELIINAKNIKSK